MKKNTNVYISHILEAIDAIESYIKDFSKDDFLNEQQTQDAVCRRLEIIGEAANKLDDEFITQHSHIPWYKIIAMRNILIHEYFSIDLDQVWNTIIKDLPTLKEQIQKI